MANLSSGITDGFNIGLKISGLASEKEKDKLLMEKTRLDMEQSTELLNSNLKTAGLTQEQTQQGIDLNNITLGYAKDMAAADLAGKELNNTYSQSRIDYTNSLTKGIVSDQRRSQITEDSALAVNILESASKLGPDSTEFERNSIASQIGFIKSPLIKAQFKNLDVDFRKSLNNLMPVFESGDFANAPESFNEDLTKILKPQIQTSYLGADFITKDGITGKVQDVVLNGDFIAKGRGDEMILGSKVTVDFGDAGVKEYQTFLPDATDDGIRTFREDLQPDDSKAVSVKDTVDFVAGQKHYGFLLDQNPRMLKFLQESVGSIEDAYTPLAKTLEAQKAAGINNIFKQETVEYNALLASTDVESLTGIKDPKDPQIQSMLRTFYNAYGKDSGVIKDGELFVTAETGADPLSVIYNNSPKYSTARSMYDGSSIEDTLNRYSNDGNANGAPTLSMLNINFPFDAPANQVKNTMIDHFSGNTEMQAEIENFDQAFNQALKSGNVQQSDYTRELKKHIEKALTSSGS